MSVLVAANAGVRHRRRWIFQELDVAIEPGDLVAIVGPPGSGRTTALLALSGRLKLNAGTVSQPAGTALGHVPGLTDPEPTATVAEHVRERLALQGRSRGAAAEVPLFGLEPSLRGRDLSPYQRHLLGLVLARMENPAVIALDDIEGGLDTSERAELLATLKDLTATGLAVIVTAREMTAQQTGGERPGDAWVCSEQGSGGRPGDAPVCSEQGVGEGPGDAPVCSEQGSGEGPGDASVCSEQRGYEGTGDATTVIRLAQPDRTEEPKRSGRSARYRWPRRRADVPLPDRSPTANREAAESDPLRHPGGEGPVPERGGAEPVPEHGDKEPVLEHGGAEPALETDATKQAPEPGEDVAVGRRAGESPARERDDEEPEPQSGEPVSRQGDKTMTGEQQRGGEPAQGKAGKGAAA